ncbi:MULTISPECIES: glycosyltransferase [Bacillus cereus group]|nr:MULTISPECIES: glycosyltransferase [Bacillus cereus group]EEL62332.1 hypothetical protein bcere0025_48920 [Bacillus cereus F65185]MDF3553263.1 glycosyltransferase [Bacillus cereus]PEY39435.1 glycosyltransferase family 1 protein [Bacillus cereus]PEY46837.1 glycosyltransferase family 1 protein [Bacillus cereus]PFC78311.1 glycosyltransferase family 1 protein [Bacillus cereus]
MKIKITYICESIGGGVRKHLVDILLNIDLQKYDISVIYGGERIDEVFLATKSTLEKKGVVFFQIQSMKRELSIKNDILCLKEIRKILKEIKPDIVHCHSSKAGAIGRIAARTCNIKKIFYTPHAYISQNPFISKKKGILFLGIERILGIISSKNIHVSKGEELFALDHNIINKKKSTVIYNGIEMPVEDLRRRDLNNHITIGTVARMDYQKNPWMFVKVAEQLVENPKYNLRFVYIGDGEYYEEILAYVKKKGLQERIILKGFHPNPVEELIDFDIFFSTSLYEGLPYSLIEALAYGKPIVASDVIGNNELVFNNYNGCLFDLNNIEQAIQGFIKILENPNVREAYSANSYQLFKEKFQIDLMVKSLENLYESEKR